MWHLCFVSHHITFFPFIVIKGGGRVEEKNVWKGVTKEDYKNKALKESSKSC